MIEKARIAKFVRSWHVHDLVIVYDQKQDRSWGFARVPPGKSVKRTDICFSLSDSDLEALIASRS